VTAIPDADRVRLLALDLDGTIIGDSRVVSPAVRQAIAAAQRKGVMVTLATGRMHSFAVPFAQELQIAAPLISYQGGMIRTPVGGEIIHRATMRRGLVLDVLEWQAQHNREVVLYAGDDAYVAHARHPEAFFLGDVGERCIWVDNLRNVLDKHEPMKMILFVQPEEGRNIEAQLKERFSPQAEVTRSHAFIVEISPPGVSKADALQRLAVYEGVPRSQVMAVGDQDNDAPMLAWARVGVAMGNASTASRTAADWIAPSLVEDGAAAAIEQFILGD